MGEKMATVEEVVDDVKIEEVVEETNADQSNAEENVPAAAGEPGRTSKQSKSEKKARKQIQKLGLKPVPGITRATIKKSKNVLFVISQPDVFKSPSSDTYVLLERQKLMISVNNLLFKKLQKPLILLMLPEMVMLLNQLQKEVMAKSMKMILN